MITRTSLKHLSVKKKIREACKVAFHYSIKNPKSKIPQGVKNRNGEVYLFVVYSINEKRFIVTSKKTRQEVTNKIYK